MPPARPKRPRPVSLAQAAEALHLPVGRAASLGLDLEAIKTQVERLREQTDKGRLPGFMTCVVKDGKVVQFEAYGNADAAAEHPLRPDTLFRLYSQTKPITVVAALKLLERGALSLDDPLSKHIPSFADAVVGETRELPSRAILVRDLLAHTSGVGFGPGFGYDPENDYEEVYMDVVRRVDGGSIKSLAEWCDEVAKLPLRFHPGQNWGYGYSSDILGRVVEVVSGRPLDQFLQAEVLDPLGMHDTGFCVPTEKASRLSALYKREPWDGSGRAPKLVTTDPGGSGITKNDSKRVVDQASDGDRAVAPTASVFLRGRSSDVIQGGGCVCSIAGGLVSSLRDFLRFGQMLLQGGELDGVRLLRPETVALLSKDWLNEFTTDTRASPMWVWDTPGIGFSPLGQIGVAHKAVKGRRGVGAALRTVHWGGAGGSGYMFSWPYRLQVLTYTGCTYDTDTQKALWRAAFDGLRRGGARPAAELLPSSGATAYTRLAAPPAGATAVSETPPPTTKAKALARRGSSEKQPPAVPRRRAGAAEAAAPPAKKARR